MATQSRPESPAALLLVGVPTGVLGAFMLGFGLAEDATPILLLGWLFVAVASIVTSISVIGVGVQMGVRRANYLDR